MNSGASRQLSCFFTKPSFKIYSGDEASLVSSGTSISIGGSQYSSKLYQDFSSIGNYFNVLASPVYYKSTLHFLSHISADQKCLQVNNYTIFIQQESSSSWNHIREMLYDPSQNVCFILREVSDHALSVDVFLQVFILYPKDFNTDKIDVDLSTLKPNFELHYAQRNQFKVGLVCNSSYLAIFANGFKYGHKKYHIDCRVGYIIDLVPYGTLQPVLRFNCDTQTMNFGSILQVKMFMNESACKLYCYVYSKFDDSFLSFTLEHDMNHKEECVKIYHIQNDVRKDSCFNYFDHCGGNTFMHISQPDSMVKILSLDNGTIHNLREFSLKTDGVEQNQLFSTFSLFHQFNKLFLLMQGTDLRIRMMDLISGEQVLSITLDHPVKSICLNWNTEEFACTRVDRQNKLQFDVYCIGRMDISLKNLSRLTLLKSFSYGTLSKFIVPKKLKSYLNIL